MAVNRVVSHWDVQDQFSENFLRPCISDYGLQLEGHQVDERCLHHVVEFPISIQLHLDRSHCLFELKSLLGIGYCCFYYYEDLKKKRPGVPQVKLPIQ